MSGFSPGLTAYQLTFQLSPIILVGGSADMFFPGSMLPIISLTEALNFTEGLLSGGENIDVNSAFANFEVMPGGTLISNKVGTYPFANQAVAANAIIADPQRVSLVMTVPARGPAGMAVKLATMSALQAALKNHNSLGGTYIVATPSFFYPNCLLLELTDVSDGQSKQVQYKWRFDFFQPLLTLEEAEQIQNAAMNRITSGLPFGGLTSGFGQATGAPTTLGSIGLVPAANISGGAGISPLINLTGGPQPLNL